MTLLLILTAAAVGFLIGVTVMLPVLAAPLPRGFFEGGDDGQVD